MDERVERIRAYLKANGAWELRDTTGAIRSDLAYLVRHIDNLTALFDTSVDDLERAAAKHLNDLSRIADLQQKVDNLMRMVGQRTGDA